MVNNSTGWSDGAWSDGAWSGLDTDWVVAGRAQSLTSISISPDAISVSFEVSDDNIDHYRAFSRSGDLETGSGHGGQFRVFDRATASGVDIYPGNADVPAVERGETWYADGYSEEQVAPTRYAVTLDCVRETNREETTSILVESGWSAGGWSSGAWGGSDPAFDLELSYGTIALDDRSVGQIDREGSPTGDDITVPLLLSSEQAAAIADAAGYPGGVTERSVPDGDDQPVDDSGRQAVTISTPGSDLADGEYLIRDWSIEFNSHDPSHRWQATLTITET